MIIKSKEEQVFFYFFFLKKRKNTRRKCYLKGKTCTQSMQDLYKFVENVETTEVKKRTVVQNIFVFCSITVSLYFNYETQT